MISPEARAAIEARLKVRESKLRLHHTMSEQMWGENITDKALSDAHQDIADIKVLLAALAQVEQEKADLCEELDCLCQAIEGHRAGALTNDGLWHYWLKAQGVLKPWRALQAAKEER